MGQDNAYVIPISIQLFATQTSMQRTRSLLMSRFDLREAPVRYGYNPPKPIPAPPPERRYVSSSPSSASMVPSYDSLLQSSIAFNPRAIREAPEKFGLSIKDLENLPVAKQPSQ